MFPFLTPKLVAKHLNTEVWFSNRWASFNRANSLIKCLVDRKKVTVGDADKKVIKRKGADKRIGMEYFNHNEAVISVLTNAYLHGHDVQYAGVKNCDGRIDDFSLEVDRGNHTKNADLEKQILKQDGTVLFVSFPKCLVREAEHNQDKQFREMKSLMRKISALNLPVARTKNLYFATYIEASNPLKDPLKEKIWKRLDGKNVSIL